MSGVPEELKQFGDTELTNLIEIYLEFERVYREVLLATGQGQEQIATVQNTAEVSISFPAAYSE